MDKTDSTLSDAPLLDDAVGTAGPELGDLSHVDDEQTPHLGDLSTLAGEDELLEADEAIPVLSELVAAADLPGSPASTLAEPDSGLRSFMDSSLEAANQADDGPAPSPEDNALDSLLGETPEADQADPLSETGQAAAAEPPPTRLEAPEDPLGNALDQLLGGGETAEEAPDAAAEPPPTRLEAPEDPLGNALDQLLGGEETAEEAPDAAEAPPTRLAEPETILEDALDQPSGAEEAGGETIAAQGGSAMEDPAHAPVAGEGPASAPTSGDSQAAEPDRQEATQPAHGFSLQEVSEQGGDAPLDLLGAASAGSALPHLRARLQEHLTHRMDDILSETVAVLVQELEEQIVERVEAVLMESLEAALPRLMNGFVDGLRDEIQPRLRAQIPQLVGEILGRGGDEKTP